MEQFLDDYHIPYQTIPRMFPGEVLSPNGKFIARADGIYLAETESMIVEGYTTAQKTPQDWIKYFYPRGWTYDSSSVIYSKFGRSCAIEIGVPGLDGSLCLFEVPQPLIKLKVPNEYLLE